MADHEYHRGPHADGTLAQSPLDDPAFQPQPEFNFEDMTNDEVHHMQRSMAHSGHFSNQNAYFGQKAPSFNPAQLYNDGSHDGSHEFAFDHMQQSLDPKAPWHQTIPSPVEDGQMQFGGGGLPQATYPTNILQNRSGSVTQQFGQITPPEESLEDFDPMLDATEAKQQAEASSSLEKSARARNAANQRHAKSKKDRSGSHQDDTSELEGNDVENKKEKYREKNRLAAAKCRAKKRGNVETLEEQHRNLSARNNFLRRAEQHLREELTVWKTRALEHTECVCGDIQQYNTEQAHQLVSGGSSANAQARKRQSTAGQLDVSKRHQSYGASSNFAFAPVSTAMSMDNMDEVLDADLTDFLSQSSPDA